MGAGDEVLPSDPLYAVQAAFDNKDRVHDEEWSVRGELRRGESRVTRKLHRTCCAAISALSVNDFRCALSDTVAAIWFRRRWV